MPWAKIPTLWIRSGQKLALLSWQKHRSDATAALIILIALAIRLNQTNGKGKQRTAVSISYDELQSLTGISRAKISAGIRLLEGNEIVAVRKRNKRNRYQLSGVTTPGSWAQLPQSQLLQNGTLLFAKFQLRQRNELHALKLYLLLIAYRNNKANFTAIGYEKICEIGGMQRNDILRAASLLINYDLITVQEQDPIPGTIGRPHKRYRICGLDRLQSH